MFVPFRARGLLLALATAACLATSIPDAWYTLSATTPVALAPGERLALTVAVATRVGTFPAGSDARVRVMLPGATLEADGARDPEGTGLTVVSVLVGCTPDRACTDVFDVQVTAGGEPVDGELIAVLLVDPPDPDASRPAPDQVRLTVRR